MNDLPPKARLRLELIRIVHSHGRHAPASLQMVHEYEKAFEGLLEEPEAPAAKPAKPAKTA